MCLFYRLTNFHLSLVPAGSGFTVDLWCSLLFVWQTNVQFVDSFYIGWWKIATQALCAWQVVHFQNRRVSTDSIPRLGICFFTALSLGQFGVQSRKPSRWSFEDVSLLMPSNGFLISSHVKARYTLRSWRLCAGICGRSKWLLVDGATNFFSVSGSVSGGCCGEGHQAVGDKVLIVYL
jgi:hypothetical protein